jgi:hypothetical protein
VNSKWGHLNREWHLTIRRGVITLFKRLIE